MKSRLLAIATSALLLGSIVAASQAQALTFPPGPLDPYGPHSPTDNWVFSKNHYSQGIPEMTGTAGQVVPTGLATGFGQNNAAAGQAANCIPSTAETPHDLVVSISRDFIDSYCRLHPGRQATFSLGSITLPSRGFFEYSAQRRKLFVRYSGTPDCLGTADTRVQVLADNATTGAVNLPKGEVTHYVCVAQGFSTLMEGKALAVRGQRYSFGVRSPWTVYKLVGLTQDAQPKNVRATAGDGRVTLAWDYNAANLAGTSFIGRSNPQDKTCEVTGARTCTITGLTNGTAYNFVVVAVQGQLTISSDRTGNVTPTAGAAAVPHASAAAGGAASTLAAGVTRVLPVRGNTVEPMTTVRVGTSVTGVPAADESVTSRTLYVCLATARGRACPERATSIALTPSIAAQSTIVWIPRTAGGHYLRTWQRLITSVGSTLSAPTFTPVRDSNPAGGQQAAAQDAGVPAGADAAEVQAVPQADAGAADAAAGAPAANVPAQAPAAAPDAAGGNDPTAAARIAGVNLASNPLATADGQGTGASMGLSMQLTAATSAVRGRRYSMKAVIAPAGSTGRVRIAFVRTAGHGTYVSSKSLYAQVRNGVAAKRWRIPRSYTPDEFTLVVSFTPAGGGAGITRTAPVTIR